MDPERIELAGLRRHLVGLLVVAPVADVADTFRGEQVGGVRRLLEVWAGPANRALAGGCVDRRDRVADILPLLVLGHADVDKAPAREAVRDELRVAPLPLLDQERVVVSDGLVERQGRRDAVLVQDGEDTKEADAIAVLVVAVAADIGKSRLVPAPQPLGAAQWADRPRRLGRHLPVPVLEVDDDGEGDAGVVRPSEHRACDNRGPRIKILVHAIGSLCRHSSTALPWRVLIKSCDCGPRRRLLVMVQITLHTQQEWRRHARTYYDSFATSTAPHRGALLADYIPTVKPLAERCIVSARYRLVDVVDEAFAGEPLPPTPARLAPASATSNSAIHRNKNTQVYHLPGCPGYASMRRDNRVPFATEAETQQAGYRKAKNSPLVL